MGANYERTKKGILNSIVAVVVQVLSLLVGFFSRKIFLDYLGTEILGLNTTACSILNFLNLAEMGIENAIAFTLYKPLYEKDLVSIGEIIAIQGWFYRRVALIIIVGSLALMPFFPLIFTKMQLPMWYAYASYLVLLFSALLGYFVNYKQIILTADQKDYKFQISYRLTMILKVVFQMLSVKFLDHPYVWWLVWEAVFAIAASVNLNSTVYRNYPFLKRSFKVDSQLVRRYPDILTKIKQMFIHRMGFFVTTQALPILIYSFTTLSMVAIYGNYMVIVNSLSAVIVALFINLIAGVGNLRMENDKELMMKVFRELYTVRFALIVFCSIGLWFLSNPFITLWIGPDYLLEIKTLSIIIAIFFVSSISTGIDNFLYSFGMFQDIWVPIVRCFVFIILAFIIGKQYGLNGVLFASLIDILWVGFVWKPYFLFSSGLKIPFRNYLILFLKLFILSVVATSIVYLTIRMVKFGDVTSLNNFLIFAFSILLEFALLYFTLLFCCEKGMRSFITRLINSRRHA